MVALGWRMLTGKAFQHAPTQLSSRLEWDGRGKWKSPEARWLRQWRSQATSCAISQFAYFSARAIARASQTPENIVGKTNAIVKMECEGRDTSGEKQKRAQGCNGNRPRESTPYLPLVTKTGRETPLRA